VIEPDVPTSAPPVPPRGRRGLQALEVIVFVVVFAAGSVLAAFAVTGGPKKAARAAGAVASPPAPSEPASSHPPATPTAASPTPPGSPSPIGSPPFIPTIPPPPSPVLGPTVRITTAKSEGRPNGCQAQLFFTWNVDRSTVPVGKTLAVIRLEGPAKAGRYTKRLSQGQVQLELVVPLGSADDRWTASIVSVGGRQADPTPLEVSFQVPFC
jgi:hypothetical protein